MSIAGTAQSEPVSFEALVAAHRGIILKVAATYCSQPEDRADLAQDIALQLWRAWPSYERDRPFSTWMYRVALNVAITRLRRAGRRDVEALGDQHEALVGAKDVDAEDRERLAIVQRAMQSLGRFDRALLLLHLEGCSHRESAEVLGTTEANIATRLGRIRQQLRRVSGSAATEGDDNGNG